jgi:hypothetical protein
MNAVEKGRIRRDNAGVDDSDVEEILVSCSRTPISASLTARDRTQALLSNPPLPF